MKKQNRQYTTVTKLHEKYHSNRKNQNKILAKNNFTIPLFGESQIILIAQKK